MGSRSMKSINDIIHNFQRDRGDDVEYVLKNEYMIQTIQNALDQQEMDPEDEKSKEVADAFQELRNKTRNYLGCKNYVEQIVQGIERTVHR